MTGWESNRRRFLQVGVAGAAVGLGGCQSLVFGGGSSVPDASFTFAYDPSGGQNGGSVTVSHDGGDGVRADRLLLRSSAGHEALWSELGSTDVAASERVTASDAARLDALVLNWPADVGFDERISVVYQYEATTSSLDEFVPDATPTPTPTPFPSPTTSQPVTVESFEEGPLARYSGDLDAFETSRVRAADGEVALRSRSTNLSVIATGDSVVDPPQRGDTVLVDVYFAGDDGRAGLLLFGTASGDGYFFDVENVDGTIGIGAFSSRDNTELVQSRVDIPSGEWLTGRVETTETTLVYILEDAAGTELASVSVTDTRYANEALGFAQNSVEGAEWVYIDNVRVA